MNKGIFYSWRSWNHTHGFCSHSTAWAMVNNIDYSMIGYLIIECYNLNKNHFDLHTLTIDFQNMDIDLPPNGINIDDQIRELNRAIKKRGRNVLRGTKNNQSSSKNTRSGKSSKITKKV